MSSELEILEKIELYTKGKLNEEDKFAFEKQLESDPQLQKRLDASLIVEQMIIGHEAMKLKEQMRKDMAEPKAKWPLYLSGALLVLAVGGVLYVTQSEEKTEKKEIRSVQSQLPKQGQKEAQSPIIDRDQKEPSPTKKSEVAASNKKEEPSLSPPVAQPQIREEMVPVSPLTVQSPIGEEKKAVSSPSVAKIEKTHSPCHSLLGEVDFYTLPACAGSENGELHIRPQSVKGGTPPFVFMIGERSSGSTFDHLSSGSYQLTIRDANNCTVQSTKTVVIQTKNCQEKKEYTFNPDFDGAWQIPYDKHKDPKSFQVMDKGGKVFYQTQVEGHSPSEWNGQSSSGLSLGLGLHFFTIEYSDGTVDEGSIVVTR